MNTVPAHFQLFQSDKNNQWYWRLRAAGNGKIIADGAEGYARRSDCIAGIRLVSEVATTPYIWDMAAGKYVDK